MRASAARPYIMSNSDFIYIRDLKVDVSIGIHEWEQRIKQTVSFDLELVFDVSCAGVTGNLADTIDYTKVIKKIQVLASSQSFALLETLTEATAALLLKEFKIKKVKLRATKFAIVPEAKAVGVAIERP
jgi:7,8-dihydroneopterin aldolase/epimerase/oxygenase